MKIYNTLTGKKDEFMPVKKSAGKKRVNIFVCGPTVYDYSHLGHARTYVVFDAIAKYLKFRGFSVFYLQNVTDVDDKIIARAREKGVSPKDLATAFTKEHLKDMKALGVTGVTKYARATDYIKEIISQIERLIDKGFAYKLEGDGIYYNIGKFKNYGKLAGRTALQAEDSVSRIDYSKDKKNRGDFCLWKLCGDPEPHWPSPFGDGRPGWHIEDTAITEKFFGAQYDIHGAARDLIFPHHEAEIAQMEALSGKSPMAKYWMHTGFLTVNGQKMAKSQGNFIVINDFLKRCPANYLRFFIVKNLWRSPVDYSESVLIEVRTSVEKIEEFVKRVKTQKGETSPKAVNTLTKNFEKEFLSELDDDFNTPRAFAVLFEFMRKVNQFLDAGDISKKQASQIYKFFQEINGIFGIIDFKKINKPVPEAIKKLVNEREKFRKSKEWQKADEARMQIEKKGFTVEDTANGPLVKNI